MLENPFEIKKPADEPANPDLVQSTGEPLQKSEENPPLATQESVSPPLRPNHEKYEYTPPTRQRRVSKRDVSRELSDEEYQERLAELNTNAEHKHYVLFFGQPASGKTWIIGSILHYMKNDLGGTVYLDTHKTTDSEGELFHQLQNRFNGVVGASKITSTDTKQYFELHISFTPQDSSKPQMDIVFIDASGEHSEQGFRNPNKEESGKLPNYLTAILESKVNTRLAFVYDQSLQDEKGYIPQVNVLNAVFTHIQHIQNSQKKVFPKVLMLSKADKIYTTDLATVERCGYDPMNYALEKIPSFANSFSHESPNNTAIFYKMGTFSVNSDLLLKFDHECPEKLFRWLYMQGTNNISPIKEPSCWDKLMSWLKGSK